ncbi:MAG TPA: hypothetical protein VFC50_01655 [Candidatus Dormibacteraeota bacterium]|nr:hypothetical protein [Candidatus Dormibacteraeota bacterium]
MDEKIQTHNQEPDPEFAQRFIDAVGSVAEYNDKHTGQRSMVTGLLGLFRVEGEPEQPQLSAKDKADMERDLVAMLQADELAEMGVTLFDTNDRGIEEADFSEPDEAAEGEEAKRPSFLLMLITDGDKFKETLGKLNPADEQREKVAGGVDLILSNTVSFIQSAYDFDKPEDMSEDGATEPDHRTVDDQLDLFMELSPALVAQGFGKGGAYKTLAEYAARHASGTLAEYREAEVKGLLDGPARWVGDSSPDDLRGKWTQGFDLLKRLRDREEPSPFFTELFSQLRADFDTARNWLDNVPIQDDEFVRAYAEWQKQQAQPSSPVDTEGLSFDEAIKERFKHYTQPPRPPQGSRRKEYVDGLRAEMDKLAKVWEESFPLENSFYLSEVEAAHDPSEQ